MAQVGEEPEQGPEVFVALCLALCLERGSHLDADLALQGRDGPREQLEQGPAILLTLCLEGGAHLHLPGNKLDYNNVRGLAATLHILADRHAQQLHSHQRSNRLWSRSTLI